MMTLEQEIEKARIFNWVSIMEEKTQQLTEKYKNNTDLYIKILNGDILAEAQEEFCREKAEGLWDAQNIWIGG